MTPWKLVEYLPELLVPNALRNLGLSLRHGAFVHPAATIYHASRVRLGRGTVLDRCLIDANTRAAVGVRIGRRCLIHRDTVLRAMQGTIVIGDRVSIQHFCALYGHGTLTLQDDVMIASHCAVAVARHRHDRTDVPIADQGVLPLDTVLEAAVWVGAHATIFSGVRVGRGAIVGAGAVVREDVPAGAVVAGVPARVIRQRA